MEFVFLFLAAIVGWSLISSHLAKKRRETLLAKYSDVKIVDRIIRRAFWLGQTQEQLLDSLGHPLDIDEKVLKTKIKETWKYKRVGKNRFALRITLENSVVIGWEQK